MMENLIVHTERSPVPRVTDQLNSWLIDGFNRGWHERISLCHTPHVLQTHGLISGARDTDIAVRIQLI